MNNDQRIAELEKALRELADEAQILVNIIKTNTNANGTCVLYYDMTIGTGKAIAEARKAVPLSNSGSEPRRETA